MPEVVILESLSVLAFSVALLTFVEVVFLTTFLAVAFFTVFLAAGFDFLAAVFLAGFLLIETLAAPSLVLALRVVLAALTATEERVGITCIIQTLTAPFFVFYTDEKPPQQMYVAAGILFKEQGLDSANTASLVTFVGLDTGELDHLHRLRDVHVTQLGPVKMNELTIAGYDFASTA